MRIAIYGGSFNPPHLGHAAAAKAAAEWLQPDKMLIIPDYEAPHKDMAAGSPDPEQRFDMCRLAFRDIPNAEISDIEIKRGGKSYTSDTLRQLMELYPGAELVLCVGTDMLFSFERWYNARWMLENIHIAAFPREDDDTALIETTAESYRREYGSTVSVIDMEPIPAASSDIRQLLERREGRELLDEKVYSYIIANRLYGAKADFDWLRREAYAMLKPKRIAHVMCCEQEAVKLAKRWGADVEKAAEAAILHDITKKLEMDEQLLLCREYGIINDEVENVSLKLLHAKTGAEIAKARFGAEGDVYEAIRWHTTGKGNMSLLEKIIYMADYIEATRDFEGVEKLRALAYEDLDKAMVLGFEMSLEDIRSYGAEPHKNTLSALEWYKRGQ